MTETAQLSAKDAECLIRARPDELWVPTAWHADIYVQAGVIEREQVFVLPEIVDTTFFDRSLPAVVEAAAATAETPGRPSIAFLSMFKWEWRKGWDVLLLAYWKAFDAPPGTGDVRSDIVLRIKTFKPQMGLLDGVHFESGSIDVEEQVQQLAELMDKPLSKLPRVEISTETLTKEQIRQLYADSDVFVLPTRGEGWGLPIVEVCICVCVCVCVCVSLCMC